MGAKAYWNAQAIGTATLLPLVIPRLYPRGGELPAS